VSAPGGLWREADRSSVWPHDAAGWNAAHIVHLLEFVGETVAIRAGRTAHDTTVLFARSAGGQVPGAVIGHWTLDGEQAGIEVGDDEEERSGRVGVKQSGSLQE
jgi:hypothetical protein